MPIVRSSGEAAAALQSIARSRVFDAHRQAVEELTESLREAAPLSSDPYWGETRYGGVRLPDSIEIVEQARPSTGRGSATFRATVTMHRYGWIQNLGSGPHTITGDPMFWRDDEPRGQEGGGPPFEHFRRRVLHPGSTVHVGWADAVLETWDKLVAERL